MGSMAEARPGGSAAAAVAARNWRRDSLMGNLRGVTVSRRQFTLFAIARYYPLRAFPGEVPMQLALTAFAAILYLAGPLHAAERTNIVFILADDMRWDMMGCAGNRIIQT